MLIKSLTRKQVIVGLFDSILVKVLQRRSKSLLIENSKQLVIYSFDQIGTAINTVGIYEKFELDTFFSWIEKLEVCFNNSTALDVGANIGNHSLYFSKYFNQVLSYEANPKTFELLKINASLSNNIKVFNFGISNKNGPLVLSSHPNDINGSSITARLDYFPIKIEGLCLDSIPHLSDVSLIKIDVEGHEYQVITGAEQLITRCKPIIIFEQHLADFNGGASPVIELLKSLGYKKFATIITNPKRNSSSITSLIFSTLLSIIKSKSVSMEIVENINPGFYPFVVALPDWIEI